MPWHFQQFQRLTVPQFRTGLTSGHSYVLQRNEVGAHSYRMSWDKTWLRLQQFRVNACLKDKMMAAAGLSGLSATGVQMPEDQMPARGVATLV